MPRYRYRCDNCKIIQVILHRLCDKILLCPLCNTPDQMVKLLTTPNIVVDNNTPQEVVVGELTKKYIEANREILAQQHKEIKGKTYEPS